MKKIGFCILLILLSGFSKENYRIEILKNKNLLLFSQILQNKKDISEKDEVEIRNKTEKYINYLMKINNEN